MNLPANTLSSLDNSIDDINNNQEKGISADISQSFLRNNTSSIIQNNPQDPKHRHSKTKLSVTKKEPANPYDFLILNWSDYFNQQDQLKFDNQDYRHVLIQEFYQNYSNDYFKNMFEWVPEKKHGVIEVYIDYQKIKSCPSETVSSICSLLIAQPFDIISSISLALEKIRTFILKKPRRKTIARFYNMDNFVTINEIKSSMIHTFVSVKGIVLRTSPIKLLTMSMDFECVECNSRIEKKFLDGIYLPPTTCIDSTCKSKIFIGDKTSAKTILYQRIRLQEINEDIDFVNSGRIPKTMECEMKENLVNTVISGDIIVVNGILKTEKADEAENRTFNTGKNKVQGLFVSYIDVNSVINTKHNKKQMSSDDEFTDNDLKMIEVLASTPNIFSLIVKSFCPAIYGHELVKAGIILAITGGSNLEEAKLANQKNKNTRMRSSLRPDCHVLLIGDPGLGKSQLLKYTVNIAPRGVYVCGNATTNAGLTVTIQKDMHSGEGSLEAGALVLSDQGVCCIDEFDKMNSEHLSLLEAMEQQTVSIAKSGVLCSLSTRTTIIASANPIGGHYNKAKSIKDNIKISNAILSRFDLIFLLLDNPDPNRDKKLSEHVMRLHNNNKKRKRDHLDDDNKNPNDFLSASQFCTKFNEFKYQSGRPTEKNIYHMQNKSTGPIPSYPILNTPSKTNQLIQKEPQIIETDKINNERFCPLSERLVKMNEFIPSNQLLSPTVIKKYLTYIKKYIHPFLSQEAAEVIKNFFISLRENSESNCSMTTTTRQLESLIRLAQARAKIECRTEVTKEDAMEVVDLMQESLFDALEDLSSGILIKNNKNTNKQINLNNIGVLSIPKQTKIFLDKLREEASIKNNYLFEYQELLRIAKTMNMQIGDFSEYIDKLNNQNYLLMRSSKLYELNSK